MKQNTIDDHGFSLIELTIVLFIIALLSSALMLGLSAQREIATTQDVERQLENAKESLLGFAISNGRLPCPADLAAPKICPYNPALLCPGFEGVLKPDGKCTSQYGVLPWLTLGLSQTDPWGNPFTYFVSEQFSGKLPVGIQASFTLESGITNTTGLADIKTLSSQGGTTIAIDLVAVIVSHGRRNAGAYLSDGTKIPGAIGDEFENSNNTQTFVAGTPTPNFDDQLVWISQHILKSRMVAVGKLP